MAGCGVSVPRKERGLSESAFGETLTVNPKPIVQLLATNGITEEAVQSTFGTATITTSGGMFVCSTGTTAFSFASLLSDILPYKPGQGSRVRLSALFTTPVADSQQIAGYITATDGLGFAYNSRDGDDPQFGILHRYFGENEIQTLQFTSGAGGSENATITINGTGYTVPLTAGTVQHNAYEAAVSLSAQVPLFTFYSNDDTVTVTGDVARPSTGSYTFSSATAAASFTQVTAGARPTEDFIAQSDWNINKFPSLDPTKINVYEIPIQYLGGGELLLKVENQDTGRLEPCHRIQYTNKNTTPSFADPNMRVGIVAASLGSTTNLTVKSASMAGFIDGEDVFTHKPHTLSNTITLADTTLRTIMSVRCRKVRGTRQNRIKLHFKRITGFTEGAKGAVITGYRDAVISSGDLNWEYFDESTSNIEVAYDDLLISSGTSEVEVYLGNLQPADRDGDLDIILNPGEVYTFTANVFQSPTVDIRMTVEIQEDV